MAAPKTSDPEPTEQSAVYHHGFFAKGAFAFFLLVPCVFVSVATVWFCVVKGKPLLLAAGVITFCLLILDYFAHFTFCEVGVTPPLTLTLRVKHRAFEQFDTFMGEIRKFNPDVVLQIRPAVKTDPDK
jgi:hypothetical protein